MNTDLGVSVPDLRLPRPGPWSRKHTFPGENPCSGYFLSVFIRVHLWLSFEFVISAP
jgi:hypothetical protein